MKIVIHQICYSEETLKDIPEGFLVLDNLKNERPDWREYWPIRNFLLNNRMDDDTLYGFFSPKFNLKTTLDLNKICLFIQEYYSDHDTVSFSPFWDLGSLFINIFEQGDFFHPGLKQTTKIFSDMHLDSTELCDSVTHSQTNIFCNYFLAKRGFWNQWLEIGEKLFYEAEKNKSHLSFLLNSETTYGAQRIPMKIFIQERIATISLLQNPIYKNLAYSPFLMGSSTTVFNKFWDESVTSDSLKLAYSITKNPVYINQFSKIRKSILEKINL